MKSTIERRFLQRIQLILFTFLFFNLFQAQQQLIELSGIIKDTDSHKGITGAHIQVENTQDITSTDQEGNFSLRTRVKIPFRIIIKKEGFTSQTVEILSLSNKITVELNPQNTIINEVVISASRVPEKVLKSPIAIEKIDIRTIRESPAASFYETLENVKGLQLLTSSLTLKVPNSRGFNSPNNFRFMQLVDGVDVQSATLGVPLGNAIGPTELDIQSMEVTPGAASALYGMNAINGLASLQTKDPFTSQGLSFYFRGGLNHVDNVNHKISSLGESAIRFAKVINKNLAIKVNASYFSGVDWISDNRTDQNPNSLITANPKFPELNNKNPAEDLWNKYGDERNNRVAVKVDYNGKPTTFNVSRTGYYEKDLVSPEVKNIKLDAGLYYRFGDNWRASYVYRYGLLDGTFQRGNKIRLQNATVQNHKVELTGKELTVRAYVSIENTGDSYNLKPLADNLDLTNLSNNNWKNIFQSALQNSLNAGTNLNDAFALARREADKNRVVPGTSAFEQLKNTIIGINNWDSANGGVAGAPLTGGAKLEQKSHFYQGEATYDFSRFVKVFNLLVGADYRLYSITPDGNNFVDFSRPVDQRNVPLSDGSFGKDVTYQKYGAFAQITKLFWDEKLKLNVALRIDRNPEFKTKFNPRVSVVYSPVNQHNFRVSFQNGFRFPSLFEALSFVNNGNVRRVGGLPMVNEGLGYLDNSYTLSSIDRFTSAVNADTDAGKSQNQAALDNKNLLVVANLQKLQPERINSFEVGYKSLLFNNRLAIDWDFYYNIYDGFLGQVEVAVPKSGNVGSNNAVLDMLNRSKQDRYRVYTNSNTTYKSYGTSLGIRYNFLKNYNINANVSYNDLASSNNNSDLFITAFNTPKWSANVSFGNREIVKNVGFTVVARWQNKFLWESPLASGEIPAFYTVDAQITWKLPEISSSLKIGATNLLNRRYFQYAAGPEIGGLYYLAYTYDLKFK
ncbi:energy transducer TonB [Elizabethkingia anophelis]|nr:energy transducer TonB [Elizabethkingia anophelis]MDV2466278.1 energy transducer TonB [Elizabethkingia anophelis]MDV3526419.1 energy transducer TonB [Elizabethkingia anophelis]MDV3824801.1 energy transducer TonB [Elizabethkingia anophelis]MDV3852021.1 energy transducer TonB [Elizabethkingia anophelis]